MINYKKILDKIYSSLYVKDVDFSLNIFLCGAETGKKDSLRDLLNAEFKKNAKFNTVYPEYIFASLYGKGKENLLELEDDLAKYVDIIVMPLEGIGTFCELGAFAVNKSLLPKIIVLNNEKHKKSKSFINLGPIDLVKKHNSDNLLYFKTGDEKNVVSKTVDKVRLKRYKKSPSYELENLFNLSRYLLYLIAFFQPLDNKSIIRLFKILDRGKIKNKYIDSAIQILTRKNRIEQDIDDVTFNKIFTLSDDGHNYVYEELIVRLKAKRDFTQIRTEILNNKYKRKRKNMSEELRKLLV